MADNPNIRIAEYSDLLAVAKMYKKALIELGHTDLIDELVWNKVEISYHIAPCFLLEINGKIAGMAGLTVVTSAWSNAASLADYMFFIQKEHRSLENLGALVLACKDFAQKSNLPLRLEFVAGTEKVRERLFKMHGFDKTITVGVFNG